MSGGFGAGFIKGSIYSVVLICGLSLAMPLEPLDPGQKSQVDLTTPSGSGFNAERNDTNPVLPDSSQPVVTKPIQKPEVEVDETAGVVADTTTASQPDTQAEIEMPSVAPEGDELALVMPVEDAAPASQTPALGMPSPEIENPVREFPINRLPTVQEPITEVTEPPAIGQDGEAEIAVVVNKVTTPTITPRAIPSSGRSAFARNRVAFDNPEGLPLLSVVLIDAGGEGLGNDVLLTFTFPVTFAVDPSASGATANAKRYARSGFEVLATVPSGDSALVSGSAASDVVAVLQGVFRKIPEAVGIVDLTDAKIQQSAKLAESVIEALKTSGHGMITYDIGLNGTDQKARRAGVETGLVFRVLDADREPGSVIKRYLDRTVLEAEKDGHVIVLGHTYPETVTALFSWALSVKANSIALAPVSAAMKAR